MTAAGKTLVTASSVICDGSRRAFPAARAIRSRTAASRSAKVSMAGTTFQYGTGYSSCMKVAFIGLGRMGAGMARGLLRAGHELTVYNRTREKADALAGDGARVAHSPA